ncbi:hypothetical protein KIW84_034817 [Lathyrus oleraceus]|uniref:Replication protein A 70 kDa DNA-binding subunit B/D first OB fold domain-containing protein n=1 Tax=Pisum sativum TaxID=3888 RepID=A0A9D4Y3Q6_PEA|nr:hypothetical protein KIW84_034817 [Pisum sativum]
MSRKVDSVKDINDSKETWRLVVRIMDVWSVVNNKGIEHLEMIVMDSLVIKENMTCIINNGSVYNNDFQWKVCDLSKKIVFLGGTTTKAIELQNIPPKGYFFKDFGEILQGKCKTDRLEDIIGVVSEINHIQSNTPGKKVVVSVVLKDLKGNCINCNLWEIYGSKFLAYYNDPKNNGAIVILLTHAMVKDGQVSNAWSGSKLLINEDIPEIQDFMSKLPTNEQKEKPTQSAKSLSNWSCGSQYSPVERFVHNAKFMSLSQFCKIKHETLCVTVATTLKFAVSKYGWFYYGCTRCSSKAPNPEKAYECSCGQKVEQPIPRYKIEIYVSNGESKYRFVFWDSECAAILGMTAEFMHNSMVENGEDDPMVYPDELEMLLNKKMAFRVKVQPTFSQASVWKLCDDEAFVKEIENDYIVEDNQSKTEYAKLVPNKENLETSAVSMLPMPGQNPRFAQLYVYDTENEIENRMHGFRSKSGVDVNIVRKLSEMLYEHNVHAQSFRMARDRLCEEVKMSRKVDSVKDINDSKETWRLAVRIMDVWSVVNNKGIEHLEMIVMDSLGDRIQVLIRHDHLLKWKEVIKENMTCIINNGSVYNNDFQWKVCDHSKKIVLLGGTTTKAIELQNIPPKGYFFKDFGEILQGKCKTDRLEDIIGAVSEINHIQSNTPGKKVVVSVVLKDLK